MVETDLWAYERALSARGYARIAGVDEAGRGPLAGPVVAAAVVLPPDFAVVGINDSKQLTARRRERLFDQIHTYALTVGIGIVEAPEIDRINILQAARKAMVEAVAALAPLPDFLLIDGNCTIDRDLPQTALVKGDARSISVAAASIVAKVHRDRLMLEHHRRYPRFGFDRHKGYPTVAHKTVIARYGPCPLHRRTFRGVCGVIAAEESPSPSADEVAAHGR